MSLYPTFSGALTSTKTHAQDLEDTQALFDQILGRGNGRPLTVTDAPLQFDPVSIDVGSPSIAEKQPGFFRRIQNQEGGREALLAFGANLLSEPNFFAGLGKGAMAYQQALNAERDRNAPQLTKDQQFSYRRNPQTGEYDFEETAAGARALQIAREKLDTSRDNTRYRADRSYDGTVYREDKRDTFKRDELPYKDRWERDRNDARIRAAELAGDFSLRRARITQESSQGRPPSAGILKQYDELATKASTTDSILAQGERILGLMDDGTLDLNLFNNLRAKGAQATGIGADDSTRAYAEAQQFVQQLVNGVLLDAKGVQTDGDAVRARIMSMVSSGDDAGARQEIQNAMRMLERGRDYSMARAEDLSSQYHIETGATDAVRNASPRPRPSTRKPVHKTGSAAGVSWRIKN